jgi:hypothetical protein
VRLAVAILSVSGVIAGCLPPRLEPKAYIPGLAGALAHGPETFAENLARYFGAECPRDQIDRLSEIDRRNIEKGTVEPGMSRQGVVFSLGYPPPHATPTLDAPKWRYWRNRLKWFDVELGADGKVAKTGYEY